MKKTDLTEQKAKNSPQGGVLVGKKEGQTIIYDDGKVGGWFVGKTHKEGGIQGIDKTTGQPIEVQTGEVIITAPALADQTPRQFQGKMMTNRQILSKINHDAGGVAFAEDGMEIPSKILFKGGSYKYGGKMMSDKEIADEINKCGCDHDEKKHLSEGMSLEDIAKKHGVKLEELDKQVEIGMEDESIHAGDYKDHFNIVKDHLVESPTFYTDENAKGQNENFLKGGLIAPNGNPSNLTLEQYHLVRTPEFKKWFGDWENDAENSSKVIDENGEPLVVYHGTNNDFNVFDVSKINASGEQVFKFTTNYQMANAYGKKVFSVFLSIKNNNIGSKYYPKIGLSKFYANTTFTNARLDLIYESKKADESQGGVIYGLTSNDLKYEGDVYFVHFSNQIKLADGTNTTFDSNNDDIRFENGGDIKSLYENENDYVKHIVESNLTDAVEEYQLQQYLKTKNLSNSGLVPENVRTDPEYIKLKRNFYLAFKKRQDFPKFYLPYKNRDRVQEQKDRKIAQSIIDKIIQIKLKKEKFVKGGEMKKENLVKDAKEGNTPARDLNNYNDMLDVQADGEVGGDTGIYKDGGAIDDYRYRILDSNNRIKYVGTNTTSWMNLERAKSLVDYSKEEKIYEYDKNGERLFEVFKDGGAVGNKKEYEYILTQRPFDIGTYPKENFIRFEQQKYRFGVVIYSKSISIREIEHFSLCPITEIKDFNNKFLYYLVSDTKQKIQIKLIPDERIGYFVDVIYYDGDKVEDTQMISAVKFLKNIQEGDYKLENQIKDETKKEEVEITIGYFKVDSENTGFEYAKKINNYFDKWNKIKTLKDKLDFEKLDVPMFGSFENENVLNQIEHFEKIGFELGANEVVRNDFKKEVKKIIDKKTFDREMDKRRYPKEDEELTKKEKSFESEGSTEGKGKLYEFFTPQIVADKMLALAQHYGFKGGNVLEPATGSGRLIKNLKDSNITAFEISKDNFEILKREFPNAELYNFNFEKAFLKEPRFNTLLNRKGTETWLKNAPFDLVMANPPYGKFSGLYSSYFKFKGQVEHFFILQTLHLLKKGGLGVYLIPSSFMRNGIAYNDIKKEIFEIAELVDAYRLPSNIFEKTQIGTDILILRKK